MRERGISLLEVVVASGIFVFIVTGATMAISQDAKTMRVLESAGSRASRTASRSSPFSTGTSSSMAKTPRGAFVAAAARVSPSNVGTS